MDNTESNGYELVNYNKKNLPANLLYNEPFPTLFTSKISSEIPSINSAFTAYSKKGNTNSIPFIYTIKKSIPVTQIIPIDEEYSPHKREEIIKSTEKTLGRKKGRLLTSVKEEEYRKYQGKKKMFGVKIHSREDSDNIMRKIKVLFHTFLLHLTNKCIESISPRRYKLKKISSSITQNISISFNKQLLPKTLREFFCSKISEKYTNSIGNENIKKLTSLKKHEDLNKLLSITYVEAYEKLFIGHDLSMLCNDKFIMCYDESPTLDKVVDENIEREKEEGDSISCEDNINYWNKVRDYAKNSFIKKILNTKERKGKFRNNHSHLNVLYSDNEVFCLTNDEVIDTKEDDINVNNKQNQQLFII